MNEETKTSWKLLDRVRNLSGLKIRILQSAENFQMMRYFTVRHWIKNIGCILGDEKPFDCKIWPYRVMNFKGKQGYNGLSGVRRNFQPSFEGAC